MKFETSMTCMFTNRWMMPATSRWCRHSKTSHDHKIHRGAWNRADSFVETLQRDRLHQMASKEYIIIDQTKNGTNTSTTSEERNDRGSYRYQCWLLVGILRKMIRGWHFEHHAIRIA